MRSHKYIFCVLSVLLANNKKKETEIIGPVYDLNWQFVQVAVIQNKWLYTLWHLC